MQNCVIRLLLFRYGINKRCRFGISKPLMQVCHCLQRLRSNFENIKQCSCVNPMPPACQLSILSMQSYLISQLHEISTIT